MSDMHITPLQQPNDQTCVHTCLAMITGKPVDQLISRFGDQTIGFYEIATVLVEHRLFPVYTTEQQHPFYASGVYLVAAPSLNRPGLLHQLVVEAGPDGYIVHDPQAGREGKDCYRNEDIQSGRISRAEVIYLDPDILAGMTNHPETWLLQVRRGHWNGRGIWSRPGHLGYTDDIHEAGRFSEEEAKRWEKDAPEKYKAVQLPVTHQPADTADDYLSCDTCGASINDMPWHYSTPDSRHNHACDDCWPKVNPAAINQSDGGAVPEGYKVIPVKPSDEMCTAAMREEIKANSQFGEPAQFSDIWSSMIAAAPQQPDQGQWIKCSPSLFSEIKEAKKSGDSADHYNVIRDLLLENVPTGSDV
jgi:hypothetical protein